jgi:hypothetical protein
VNQSVNRREALARKTRISTHRASGDADKKSNIGDAGAWISKFATWLNWP